MSDNGSNSAGQLRFIIERLSDPVGRAVYVAARFEQCVGINERTTLRAIRIAGRIFGVRLSAARAICGTLVVGCQKTALQFGRDFDPSLAGFVYECEPENAPGRYKIGFSRQPEVRLKQIAGAIGSPVKLIRLEAGTMLDEHVSHCRARRDRVHGEWFVRHRGLH